MTKVNKWMEDQQVVADVVPEPEIEIVDVVPEPEPTPTVIESKVGIVVNCPRLNVRMKPRADADVICVIDRDSKVMIDEENSTKNFYKICAEVGVEGYCMKQFINVLK